MLRAQKGVGMSPRRDWSAAGRDYVYLFEYTFSRIRQRVVMNRKKLLYNLKKRYRIKWDEQDETFQLVA